MTLIKLVKWEKMDCNGSGTFNEEERGRDIKDGDRRL